MKLRLYGKDYTKKYSSLETRECRFECFCACTGILFFLPFVSFPDSRFGRFWANQGLLVLILEVVLSLVGFAVGSLLYLLGLIPLIGIIFRILKAVFLVVLSLICLLYWVLGFIYVGKGRACELPIIGSIRIIR